MIYYLKAMKGCKLRTEGFQVFDRGLLKLNRVAKIDDEVEVLGLGAGPPLQTVVYCNSQSDYLLWGRVTSLTYVGRFFADSEMR